MSLVSELRHDFVLLRRTHQLPNFFHGMRQWFLAINMFAAPHRLHRNQSVRVIRRANHHPIDFLPHLIEHHSIVGESLCIGVFRKLLGGVVLIHITQSDNVVAQLRNFAHIRPALAANANSSDVQFLARRKTFRSIYTAPGRMLKSAMPAPVRCTNCLRFILRNCLFFITTLFKDLTLELEKFSVNSRSGSMEIPNLCIAPHGRSGL